MSLATDETGYFAVDLPSGQYDVTVEADGFEQQTQITEVDENGVSILNFELRKQKKPKRKNR